MLEKILILCLCFILVNADQSADHKNAHGKFGSKDEIHDIDHLKQHLEDKIEINNKTFDPNHRAFYYFNLHNLNKDAYIDGLELMKGITHTHEGESLSTPMTDEEIEYMIDMVLKDFDINGDGLIDYAEYVAKADR